jgi:hypothetical protein
MDDESIKLDQEVEPQQDSIGNDIDLESALEASPEPAAETSPEDTGDSADIQAQLPAGDPQSPVEASKVDAASQNQASSEDPRWVTDLKRYHYDMNGLLAAKENYKIVAVDKSAKPSFYRQWSAEANNVMRITAILRRRLATYNNQPKNNQPKKAS